MNQNLKINGNDKGKSEETEGAKKKKWKTIGKNLSRNYQITFKEFWISIKEIFKYCR